MHRTLSRADGLLVVYCILFKSGQFEGLAAKQDYIESCQSVQNSGVFRTYCNILAFVCAGGLVYGLDTSQRQGDQQATQNLIISGLVSGPPPGWTKATHRLSLCSRASVEAWRCTSVVTVDSFYNRCGCAVYSAKLLFIRR